MRRILGALALCLALASPAAAQLSIDVPSANSTSNVATVAGWAGCAAGPGAGVNHVDVWLMPLPRGDWEYLGAATLGIQRHDVAVALGNANYEYSGYSLSTSNLHVGDALIYVAGRCASTGTFDVSSSVTATVYESDPFWPNPSWTHLDAVVESIAWLSSDRIAVAGYGVRDGHVLAASQIGVEVLVDDSSTYGYGAPDPMSFTRTVDCASYTAEGWDCEAPRSNDMSSFGLYGVAKLTVRPGWHYLRLYVFDTNPYDNLVASSNAYWFYVP